MLLALKNGKTAVKAVKTICKFYSETYEVDLSVLFSISAN